ncbi:MAG TPA: protoglobin family protein [Dehalococcoidia bacterium]|nr:protoglobin family protein [Dehalococcoidia bacterium]
MPQVVDWSARMREMVEFVGLTPAELELVRATGPLVLKHAEELTAAVYDHFLKFPQARQFFLTDDGQVDPERLARRKHSLARWLRDSIEFRIDEEFPVQLLATAVVHSHPPTHREHLGSVPSRFMIGTIAFAQTALAQVLRQELADPDQAWRASLAWNKLLMVELDILLAGYVNEQPTEPRDPCMNV